MAFSKSKFLTLFVLFCTLHLAFSNEEVVDNPISQSEIVGQRLPYTQDCCNYGHDCFNNGHSGNCDDSPNYCGGGDYCNLPPHVQNGCGCVQNPSNRCCVGSACQPYPPSCPVQGPCPSCGCMRSNVKVEAQHESDHPSSESVPSKH